jgi:hypothetical protein
MPCSTGTLHDATPILAALWHAGTSIPVVMRAVAGEGVEFSELVDLLLAQDNEEEE